MSISGVPWKSSVRREDSLAVRTVECLHGRVDDPPPFWVAKNFIRLCPTILSLVGVRRRRP